MTRPGKALISLADAPYYRITSRCVPKALASAKALASLMGWAPLMGQALPKVLRGAGSTSRLFCGVDHYSGQSYEHRRQWGVDRIVLLSSLFAIDVCTYGSDEQPLPSGAQFMPRAVK
jgi:hypothetical protein